MIGIVSIYGGGDLNQGSKIQIQGPSNVDQVGFLKRFQDENRTSSNFPMSGW